MSPEKWLEVKEIFNAALDLPAAARKSFIAEKCADEALRAEVVALLDSADEAEDFIETPALTRVSRLVTAEKTPSFLGRQIGAYRIEKELGKGGMGAVYLASRADREFDKKVAIKLIKRGFDTDEIIERFRHERQILAALEHPNITRLIDGGSTEDGLPYLVMDYVEGLPLGRYCATRSVSLEERLAIFLKICAAVNYAHRNLIIHRDLKPSNILVSEDGEPKLLDFGIAKLTSPNSLQTHGDASTAFRVMTPEYASPEQVGGQPVTTASDVYSLGVILYELLTGQRPFRLRTNRAEEISRIITETAPTRPSDSLRSVEGEKGRKGEGEKGRRGEGEKRRRGEGEKREISSLEAEDSSASPRRRVSASPPLLFSSSALKGDLDNIILMAMRKEPERRYSSVEQFAEDIRRYLDGRPVIAREDSFSYRAEKFVKRNKAGVAAGVGIALSLVGGLIAASRQAKIARGQRDRALRETEKAERINQFLQKMLASADPRERGRDVRVLEVLGEAGRSIEMDFADQPDIKAALHTTIGTTYLNLGLLEPAEDHLGRALDLRLKCFPRRTAEVAASLNNFGLLLKAKGDLKAAEPLYREALEIFRRLRRPDDVAEVLDNLGYLLAFQGKNREALAAHAEELEIRRALYGENHPKVAKTIGSLANVFGVLGERRKNESLQRRALEILRAFYDETHPDVITAMARLASVLMFADKTEAEKLFEKVLRLRRTVLGENHPDVAWTLYDLAFLNAERGDYAAAERLAREVLAMRRRGLTDEHPAVSSALLTLGRSLLAQGRPETARPALEECLALRRKTLNANHWLLATANSFYGECLLLLGETERGKRLLRESCEVLLEKLGPAHDQTRAAAERRDKYK
ncbi:MAG: serine/threonine protein kinase [Acidobacteria bacterium]|nr:serine/threonine protein kinase [Acidobacteriota bacterium]